MIFNFLSFFFWVYLQAKNKSTGFVKAFIAYYWPALELRNKQMTIYGKCLEHRLSHIWILRWLEGLTRTEGFSQMWYMPQISTYGIRYVAHIMRLRHQLLFCCRLGSNPRWLFLYHQVKTLINFLIQVKSLNSKFFIQQPLIVTDTLLHKFRHTLWPLNFIHLPTHLELLQCMHCVYQAFFVSKSNTLKALVNNLYG